MPFEVSTTCGIVVALMVPSSGIETWKSDSSSSRNASNSSSARSISSISSTGGCVAPDRRQQRPLQQIFFRKDLVLDGVGIVAAMGLDRQQLPLVVPFVQRRRLIEPLIALQADQFGRMHGSQRFCDLGLADARLAFQQQRPPQQLHQRDRGREFAVGDIAGGGQRLRDLVAGFHRYANTPKFFAAFQLRQKSCGIWMWVDPRNENASLTALENAGTPPTFGLSPTPLAPIG